ncbi:MAG: cytochrome c3 family protein [Bacteroidota bacterium]
MRHPELIVLLFLMTVPAIAEDAPSQGKDQCFACHQAFEDPVAELYVKDVHYKTNISCADCHGGNSRSEDMDEAMSEQAGFVGVPRGDQSSERCAQCHSDAEYMKAFNPAIATDQFSGYTASVHGRNTIAGGERLVQCTTCHGVHNILPVRDPRSQVSPAKVVRTCVRCHGDATFMRQYNPALPVDQLEKYKTSEHGRRWLRGDGKAAQCVSCHGNHDILPASDVRSSVYAINLPSTCSKCHGNADYMKEYGIPTNQFRRFSESVHGKKLLEERDVSAPSCNDCHGNHGAVPPGVQSISNVCGTCHALNAKLFAGSPHKKAFDEGGIPECEVCHGNHYVFPPTRDMLGVDEKAICSDCHYPSGTSQAYSVAAAMRMLVDSLSRQEEEARRLLEEAEQKGMEVSESRFHLRAVRQAVIESRTVLHSFDLEKYRGVITRGLVVGKGVTGEAQEAIEEYYFRRIGLGISTLIITVLAVAIYLRIRRIERRGI